MNDGINVHTDLSPGWRFALIVTPFSGFSLLTYLSARVYRNGPPITEKLVMTKGVTLPHKRVSYFPMAVGLCNFAGSGIFGFLINLPIVSYVEIGTVLTLNHRHDALMGVFGMGGRRPPGPRFQAGTCRRAMGASRKIHPYLLLGT